MSKSYGNFVESQDLRPIVSILVGSGFSIPEGLPSVTQLNERLSKINESEILIHTDQRALFLKGQDDPNRWANRDERFFLQEFLEFYNKEVLQTGEIFHYETFYDFYSGYLANEENKKVIEKYCLSFNLKFFGNKKGNRDSLNRISAFNRSFNQLLASQLHKVQYFEDVSWGNYPPYDSFIAFLAALLTKYDVKFHSLNHDLFFDWLGRHQDKLWQHYSDGYQLEGSPFYGVVSYDYNKNTEHKVHKTYHAKLERFTDKYDKPLAFYKLHGSIFNTLVYSQINQQHYRLKNNYGVSRYLMEHTNPETGEQYFENLWDESSPDFISGTTNKTRYYTGDPYYKILLNHFEENLSISELLVVIGYGFRDGGINDYLEANYLSKGKHMIVIDPKNPNSELMVKYNATYISKGVTELSNDEYLELIPK